MTRDEKAVLDLFLKDIQENFSCIREEAIAICLNTKDKDDRVELYKLLSDYDYTSLNDDLQNAKMDYAEREPALLRSAVVSARADRLVS